MSLMKASNILRNYPYNGFGSQTTINIAAAFYVRRDVNLAPYPSAAIVVEGNVLSNRSAHRV